MPTLNDYRKQAGFKSIKAFVDAANQAGVALRWTSFGPFTKRHEYANPFTLSIAQQWLHGYIREDLKPEDEAKLLALLNITEEQLPNVREESQEAYMAKWREKHPITPEILVAHEASIKETADAIYAKMTPAQRANIHQEAIRLGIAQPDRRSPLDILIDRACGIE